MTQMPFSVLLTDKHAQEQAKTVTGLFPSNGARFTAEAGEDGSGVQVPVELSKIIAQVVQAVALGRPITVDATSAELTTTAAARLLGVSRPTVMAKINAGEIPSHEVGSHTRLRTADVLEEEHDRRQRQLAAFDELRALEVD